MARHEDGTLIVTRADDTIGVHPSLLLLGDIPPQHIQDGLLVFDTAGEYRYRPTAFDWNPTSTVVICERVYPEHRSKEP